MGRIRAQILLEGLKFIYLCARARARARADPVNINLITFSDIFDSLQLGGDIFLNFVIAIAATEAVMD